MLRKLLSVLYYDHLCKASYDLTFTYYLCSYLRELLLKHKVGRTMLLTTHFMDEADLLGDRIAIMSDGFLRCLGTPMFLKNRFGVGYHMTLVKSPSCDTSAVERLIVSSVPGSKLVGEASAELSFILPREQSSVFPQLFTSLETHRANLGISNYGVSVTTMEEVFLKVSSGELSRPVTTASQERLRLEQGRQELPLLTGTALLRQQFRAMFIKRFVLILK
jgi:ABC-type sugar transport system ATPase subunit